MTEQLKFDIPFNFIKQLTSLNWREIVFGIEQDLMHPNEAINIAIELLMKGDESTTTLELASSQPDDAVMNYIYELASTEPIMDLPWLQRKWAYILLAWVWMHRELYSDPLSIVEKTYADLDYPEQLTSFVRYMPSDEPTFESKTLNEQRLLQKWADYLKKESHFFNNLSKNIS